MTTHSSRLLLCLSVSVLAGFVSVRAAADAAAPVMILPGVWRYTIGSPEAITPVTTRQYQPSLAGLASLPSVDPPPVHVRATTTERGVVVRVLLVPDEQIYGLGLQLQSFQQRATKKHLRVNADPTRDTGDTHAPVPFYVTTRGYGVFVDTARYTTFYLGNKVPASSTLQREAVGTSEDGWNGVPPYERRGMGAASEVLIEVPAPARGVDVYVFGGPSLREAVQRYNLFSGGGALPPRWGLGFWYRTETKYDANELLALAAEFRERRIPCDVLGLEPGWQSHSYSSSYRWSTRFPDPADTIARLAEQHFRVNLWEQGFVHPTSPIHRALSSHAGDFEVWGGLVPDFLQPAARDIFAGHHAKTFVELGVAGFKADECDNSDFTGNWSFPELSRFPSGADGEQMHMLFGLRYLDALQAAFAGQDRRTYGLVRSSGALAAPYPYVLYSDLYDHRQFVHGVAQAGFSGLLWTPEVRDASGGPEELVRRLQAVALSPLAMINAWYLKHPPWKQVNRADNNAGRFAANWQDAEAQCRAVIELRMRLIPYLHAAFVRYHREGLPPFRALLMDYPDDPQVLSISDQYLVGDEVLVAPIIAPNRGAGRGAAADHSRASRKVYLPEGEWHDFWTGERISGGQFIEVIVPIERIPMYVRSGAILPLARATLHTEDPASWELEARVYGRGDRVARLYDDDGRRDPSLAEVRLRWDAARDSGAIDVAPGQAGTQTPRYRVVQWTCLP